MFHASEHLLMKVTGTKTHYCEVRQKMNLPNNTYFMIITTLTLLLRVGKCTRNCCSAELGYTTHFWSEHGYGPLLQRDWRVACSELCSPWDEVKAFMKIIFCGFQVY